MKWKGVNPGQTVLFVFVLLALGSLLFAYGAIQNNNESRNQRRIIEAQTQTAVQIATAAANQASNNSKIVFAVCRRFSRDESASLWQSQQVAKVEMQFPHPNPSDPADMAYHAARIQILKEGVRQRQLIAKLNCPTAMGKALREAK